MLECVGIRPFLGFSKFEALSQRQWLTFNLSIANVCFTDLNSSSPLDFPTLCIKSFTSLVRSLIPVVGKVVQKYFITFSRDAKGLNSTVARVSEWRLKLRV